MCNRCTAVAEIDDVEKILSVRHTSAPAPSDPSAPSAREFHIKHMDHSYVHTDWVPESVIQDACQILPGLKSKYRNFLQRLGECGGVEGLEVEEEEAGLEHGVNPLWRIPERVIAAEEDSEGTRHVSFL
jgi:hypothetical protein